MTHIAAVPNLLRGATASMGFVACLAESPGKLNALVV